MKQQRIHFHEILDHLNAFEAININWLCSSELYGWNDWFILKKTFFIL